MRLSPRMPEGSDTKIIGKKIGRNLSGVLAGIGASASPGELDTGPTDTSGMQADMGEDVTPPLATASSPQYPRYKPLTGFNKFADALGGGKYALQGQRLNEQSALAEAGHNARLNEEQVKGQNAQTLQNLEATNKVLNKFNLSPEQKELFTRMIATHPETQELLWNQFQNFSKEQETINNLNRAKAAEAQGQGKHATAQADTLAEELPYVAEKSRAGIEGTRATTASTTEKTREQKAMNDAGIVPIPGSIFMSNATPDPTKRVNYIQPFVPGQTDINTLQKGPPVQTSLGSSVLGATLAPQVNTPTAAPANTWEDDTYIYRKLPDGTTQRKLKVK